eukprot:SAG31_NODE_3538_length_4145_cov_1.703658_6_plen_114_part_00
MTIKFQFRGHCHHFFGAVGIVTKRPVHNAEGIRSLDFAIVGVARIFLSSCFSTEMPTGNPSYTAMIDWIWLNFSSLAALALCNRGINPTIFLIFEICPCDECKGVNAQCDHCI